MTTYALYKETAVPGTMQPNAIYFIAPTGSPDLLEIYVTNSAGNAERHTHTNAEIQAMIDASVSALGSGAAIVDDIAARDALTPANGSQVYVIDASGDPTVSSGGATYIYRSSNTTWIKQSESESLDVALTWASITGGPSSTPAQIDQAVTDRHTHANKTQLDNIDDSSGNMTYSGSTLVKTGSLSW